ncbi:DinB family protein [Rossellomorea vietnamensis]|uniref:DinB family protein n=2 Tax=Rossellomorea TaxID=2837508 RepID=A0A5D4KKP6_9BACI|nr:MULTISPECIES: DinB family protein [Rossellomorea]TYR77305.1 DinB family protein [Rossellomorea vietnamensis]TYS78141.1 DinB family protein [Rossellomorea aquimaris]
MMDPNTVTDALKRYNDFLEGLVYIDEKQADLPLAKGKWSTKQVISHMYGWDLYLLETVLPSALIKKAVSFPSHNEFNARSLISTEAFTIKKLIEQSIHLRNRLLNELKMEKYTLILDKPLTVNGISHCPNTGSQYTLAYLMYEFADHDNYHSRQIIDFMKLQSK